MTRAVNTALAGSGGVLQVVAVSKNDVFSSTTTTTYTDITGLSVSITPSSENSRILILANIFASIQAPDNGTMRLLRGATPISVGTATGVQTQSSFGDVYNLSNTYSGTQSLNFLDSPATTSSVTYKIQFFLRAGTFLVNANYNNTNFNYVFKPASNITLLEIAG